MAANLNEVTLVNEMGQEVVETSFAGNIGKERKDLPWHGLGQFFDRPMTSKEAIEASHSDFGVNKGTLLHANALTIEQIKNNQPIDQVFNEADIITSHMCTYREDNNHILGVVGSGYEVVPNFAGFEFIDKITGVGENNALMPGAFIETAGVLGNGERVFCTAKLPSNIRIGDSKDIVTDYILFTNSHNGSNAVTACFTPVRVVCNNTLNAALQTCSNRVTFKHTKNIASKLAMAVQVMNVHKAYTEQIGSRLIEFSQQAITDTQIKNLVAQVFLDNDKFQLMQKANGNYLTVDEISTNSRNRITEMLNCIETGVGQEMYKGTKLWVYNGFTSFYQNVQEYKYGNAQQMDSLIDGNGYKKTQKAMDCLLAM